MEKLVIGLLLAMLPIISWIAHYNISKKEGNLDLFKRHPTIYYSDWTFVIFNLLWVYSAKILLGLHLSLFLILIVFSVIAMIVWRKIEGEENNKRNLIFEFNKKIFTNTGWVHMAYFLIQGFLIIVFIFSNVKNIFVYLSLIPLLIYFLLGVWASKRIHSKFVLMDKIYVFVGLLAILGKLIYTMQ